MGIGSNISDRATAVENKLFFFFVIFCSVDPVVMLNQTYIYYMVSIEINLCFLLID